VGDLLQDARHALTMMRRNKAFTAAGLLTMALGIGATTAVFSIVYGVLLRPLPYPGADRFVRVWEEHPGGTPAVAGSRWITNRTYYAWTDHPQTIDVLGGYGSYETTIGVGGPADNDQVRVFGGEVSPALFSALGARPALGRLFTAADAEPNAKSVLILSDAMWRDLFSADPSVIGRAVIVDDDSHEVVGIVAPGFSFPDRRARFWTPYKVHRVPNDPLLAQRTSGLSAIARLAPGVTAAQVEAEGTAAARSVPVTASTQLLFGKGGPPVMHARSLIADVTADVKPALLVLAAAVGCVLLIACANIANLFLSRGVARQRELAVRAAIGAGRGRLARQLLTESFILSAGGGLLGLGLAAALVRLAVILAPARFPRLDDVQIDSNVLVFTALASIVTALASGLAPALRGARFDLAASLHGGDGATTGGFRGLPARRMRDGLLIAESAFAAMLIVGAALLARSFVRLVSVDAGYTADHVLTARILMPRAATPERTSQFITGALDNLRAVPGVRAAGAGSMMPLLNVSAVTTFNLPPDAGAGKPTQTRTLTYIVTPGYAQAVGLRLRAGRFFDDRDAAAGTRAMIVNDEFVRRYLSDAPVVGRRFPALYANETVQTEIVGVVGTVLKDGNDRQPQPEVYFVHGSPTRRITAAVNMVLRTSGDPGALAALLRKTARDVDPTVVVERVESLSDQLTASMAQPRFATSVLVTFAVIALTLATVGLYGVLSYAVSQRRREIGVRAALGATRSDIVTLVVHEGLLVTAAGLALGLAGAAALTRVMQGLLFGVTPLDALSFAAAPLMLVPVAIVACLLPAYRAARIDPAEALRTE
jgi:predicted permease